VIDYVRTYGRLERALASIEQSAGIASTLSGILGAIMEGPGPELGIIGARLYRREPERGVLVLLDSAGSRGPAEPGFEFPLDYPPLRRLFRDGFLLMEEGDPEFDPALEGRVGVQRFAAITVGDTGQHIIAFTITSGIDPERAIYLLGTLRHVINLKMVQTHLLQDIEEARRIQLSLLPRAAPAFHGFDIAARSLPAEEVGGDLYDYLALSDQVLGVAVADSCGHGLPAALMARDVITGLRVALDVQYRLTRGIERVNRVVARSALASRFISLIYVEFEPTGNMVYCNAGHPPGLLCREGRITPLRLGGPVLGPVPTATYERGFERFPPDATLLLYTDGITDAEAPGGERFGTERLEHLLADHSAQPATTLVDRIFDAVATHAPGPRGDDQTVVVIRRAS
jgi:sigma-B regulation protein RsbU (phosphoserine phosphatase)